MQWSYTHGKMDLLCYETLDTHALDKHYHETLNVYTAARRIMRDGLLRNTLRNNRVLAVYIYQFENKMRMEQRILSYLKTIKRSDHDYNQRTPTQLMCMWED